MGTNSKEDKPQAQDSSVSQIMQAEAVIALKESAARKEESLEKRSFPWKNLFYTTLSLAALSVIFYGLPGLTGARFSPQPLRSGSYMTDSATDRCISNLWAVAAALRTGGAVPLLTCPASRKPYIITNGTVSCPDPHAHGVKKLYADKKNVMPSLEK